MKQSKPSFLFTEPFETKGRFWTSGFPEKSVAGVLRFVPEGNITLVTEPFPATAGDCLPDIDSKDFTLHGSLEDGGICSLLNASVIRQRPFWTEGGMALETRELRARSLVVGDHVNSEDEGTFRSVAVRFPHLHEWTGAVMLEVEQPTDERASRNVKLPYTQETMLSTALPNIGKLYLSRGLGLKHDAYGRMEVSYDTRFRVVTDDLMSVMSVLRIARQLQDLITLLFGVPVTPDLILARRTREPTVPGAHILYIPVGDNRREPRHSGMVPFKQCREQLPHAITAWFSEAQVLDTVRPLLLGTIYGRQGYVENKFLSLAQAVESLHRVSKGGTVVSKAVYNRLQSQLVSSVRSSSAPPEIKKRLEEHLAFGNELSFETRIRWVVEQIPAQARKLVVRDTEDFVGALKQTRNYLTHPGTRKGTRVLGLGAEMFYFNQRLQALLTLVLLQNVGLTRGVAEAVAKRIWDA